MTPDRAAFVAAVLAVTVGAMVLLALWFERRARRAAAADRLRRRLFDVGIETERERDAAMAAVTRFHIAANRAMDYDRALRDGGTR